MPKSSNHQVLFRLEEENESLAKKSLQLKKKLKSYQKQYKELEKQVEVILSKNAAEKLASLVFGPKKLHSKQPSKHHLANQEFKDQASELTGEIEDDSSSHE